MNKAEKARRTSERLQAAVLDSLAAHIAVLDRSGRIIAVNESWLRFARENGAAGTDAIGVGTNYLAAGRAAAVAGDAYAEAALSGIGAVLQGDQPDFQIEYPCHSPDRQRWFLMHVTRNTSEDIGGAIVTHTDVTQRRLAVEMLRAGEEQYRLLFAANPNPMFVFDDETLQFLAVNDAAVRHYGWSRSELLALTILDIRPSADRLPTLELIEKSRGAREAQIGVVRHCRIHHSVGVQRLKEQELVGRRLEIR